MTPTKKAPRYALWSTKAIVLASLPVVTITGVTVFWASKSSAWVEWQLTLAALSTCLFVFMTIGLYRGVRLQKPPRTPEQTLKPDLSSVPLVDFFGVIQPVKVDLPDLSDAGDDLVGCLLTIALWVAATILFAILFWLVAQFLVVALPALLFGMYWVYYRALRIVFAKSRVCKGRIWRSLGYGLLYTSLYMGWLFAVTWLGWLVFASGRGG